MVLADLALGAAAFVAISRHVTIEQLVATPSVGTLGFAALVAQLSLLYWLHAYIWNFPRDFVRRCGQLPLSLLGATPVKVFSKLEILGKVQQLGAIVAFWGAADAAAAVRSAAGGSGDSAALLGLAFVGVGQLLNVATYAAIGDAGVYYGFKLGATVPWCHGFPFNTGLRHPQYTGVALTTWGLSLCLINEPTFVESGAFHAASVVFPLFYVVMSWMEQAGDNDKKSE